VSKQHLFNSNGFGILPVSLDTNFSFGYYFMTGSTPETFLEGSKCNLHVTTALPWIATKKRL
jgi:hypothetical protein